MPTAHRARRSSAADPEQYHGRFVGWTISRQVASTCPCCGRATELRDATPAELKEKRRQLIADTKRWIAERMAREQITTYTIGRSSWADTVLSIEVSWSRREGDEYACHRQESPQERV
jgi:hypothetical protein